MSDERYQRFSDRFFEVSPLYTRPGWYIKLREGNVIGPFSSKAKAQIMLFNLFGLMDPEEHSVVTTAEPYSGDTRGG